ncbi:unnamed protein product [Phyllotreta striolata]|uniref:Uncharacterized protein n=1 Tax=Phyllotreta striolata TaxID=444603 RepID=A0A9N9TWS2_PHYSR|nr:unnamed protein product [Phyllotreta striolata]
MADSNLEMQNEDFFLSPKSSSIFNNAQLLDSLDLMLSASPEGWSKSFINQDKVLLDDTPEPEWPIIDEEPSNNLVGTNVRTNGPTDFMQCKLDELLLNVTDILQSPCRNDRQTLEAIDLLHDMEDILNESLRSPRDDSGHSSLLEEDTKKTLSQSLQIEHNIKKKSPTAPKGNTSLTSSKSVGTRLVKSNNYKGTIPKIVLSGTQLTPGIPKKMCTSTPKMPKPSLAPRIVQLGSITNKTSVSSKLPRRKSISEGTSMNTQVRKRCNSVSLHKDTSSKIGNILSKTLSSDNSAGKEKNSQKILYFQFCSTASRKK